MTGQGKWRKCDHTPKPTAYHDGLDPKPGPLEHNHPRQTGESDLRLDARAPDGKTPDVKPSQEYIKPNKATKRWILGWRDEKLRKVEQETEAIEAAEAGYQE